MPVYDITIVPTSGHGLSVKADSLQEVMDYVEAHGGSLAAFAPTHYDDETVHIQVNEIHHQEDAPFDIDIADDPANTLPSYAKLLKIAREGAEGLLRDALWDLHFSEQAEKDVLKSIEMRKIDCVKLGLDVEEIERDFNDEYSIDEDDETEGDE